MEVVGGNTEIAYIDSTLTKSSPITVTGEVYEKFSYNNLGGYITFACLRADSTIDVVSSAGNNTALSTDTTKNYSDISLLEQLNQYIIFAQKNDTVDTFTNLSLPPDNGANWGIGLPVNINDISNINEVKINGTQGLTTYKEELGEIITYNVDPNNINEDSVKLKDFGFNKFSSNEKIFVYSKPTTTESSGIVRLDYDTPTISVNVGNQMDDADQTETFITMSVIDDNRVVALFTDGIDNKLYLYDYTNPSTTVSTLIVPATPIKHRNVSEPSPNISFYDYKIVDISYYKGSVDTFVILFEIIDNLSATPTGCYDVAFYNFSSNDFSSIPKLYTSDGNEPNTTRFDAVDNDGNYNSDRCGDGGTGIGGLKYLFNSVVEPRLDVGNNSEYIYFYFGGTGTADFLKILISDLVVTTLVNNEISDLEVEIAISGFNHTVETVTSVSIFPDPNVGSTNPFLTITTGITAGTSTDKVKAIFTNSGGFKTGINYTFHVNTTLSGTQITTLNGSIDNNSITDFRVYGNTSNKIIIRKVIGDNPINTIDFSTDYYQLSIEPNTGHTSGTWQIQDSGINSLLELKAPIQPSPTGTAGVYTGVLDNNQRDYILQPLDALDNNYELDIINKGYKVDNDDSTLSPHLTGRVLLNTLVHEDVLFNNLGTKKTAHLVSSTSQYSLTVHLKEISMMDSS
jgi:hypothetical protein